MATPSLTSQINQYGIVKSKNQTSTNKCFIGNIPVVMVLCFGPEANPIKLFTAVIYEFLL
jgi:hypothetical protein